MNREKEKAFCALAAAVCATGGVLCVAGWWSAALFRRYPAEVAAVGRFLVFAAFLFFAGVLMRSLANDRGAK